MKRQPTTPEKAFLAFTGLVAWFALIAQFYLIIKQGANPVAESIIRYFTYFTILTNLLVAVCCTTILLRPGSSWGRFFLYTTTLTAITVYIVVVGITYNVILRSIWNPQGLQRLVDELLHVSIPVLFLLYWLLFVPKAGMRWKDPFPWMIYPFVYGVVVLIRGSISGYYPYPFFEVPTLGAGHVAINTVGLIAVFLVLGLLFVGAGKLLNRKNHHKKHIL